eukprot:CAMPEP_0172478018 /NCGR_PEP_ID=MMETSP1066-20121228/1706_1 /TAXON_ID=671091 /ORGANISM="Coscinodiscus wailesii, Strain CCMP2513" /LENGTH=271 /DNA_ID=CAMNT_0013237193 /DNA_START=84 /DNA_END=900 /DNA_ORIENTATION=-
MAMITGRRTTPVLITYILSLLISSSNAFHTPSSLRTTATQLRMSSSTDIYLTPKLAELCKTFSSVRNVKMRYMYLLEVAKQVPDAPEEIHIPENKVPGCLSTVYIDCEVAKDEERGDVINYIGWSDGLLTKGMMSVLVQGLSGHTVNEIEQVQPEFIKLSKIDQALTPGRNNGYLNMLATMKRKAREAIGSGDTADDDENNLMDNSDQHAGHAGSKGWEESGESHFQLEITSGEFEGVRLVKRHQMVYGALGDVMSKIHALQISAKAPSEV